MVNLALYQKGLGHEIWMGCERGRSLERSAGYRGFSILEGMKLDGRFHPIQISRDISALSEHIRKIRPDVIHCHLNHDHWIAGLARRKAKSRCRIVRTIHRYKKPYSDPLHRFLFQGMTDSLIVPSQAMKKIVLQVYPRVKNRIHVVYGGVNLEKFNPGVSGAGIRKQLGIPEDAVVGGVVSRIREDRGFQWLFRSLKILFEKTDSGIVMIAGKGEMKRQIQQWIKEPPFAGRVIMAGYRSRDLANAYAAMDFSIFIAHGSEGSCRAVMEAMACGRPVVGLNRGVVPENINPGETGYIVQPDNDEDLAEKLKIMFQKKEELKNMGRAARLNAEKRFRLMAQAEKTVQLYRELF